jgi:hypothetical protein
MGGIHRRAEGIEALRTQDPGLFLVSAGNLVVEGGRQQQIKIEHFLMSMAAMGYQALVPGPGEFQLGADYLVQAKDLAGFPFVLGNVRKDGQTLFPPSLRLGDSNYVLTGLNPAMPEVSGVEVVPAAEALREFQRGLDERDRVLIIWNGKEEEVKGIAEALSPAVRPRAVVAFGASSDLPRALDSVNGVRIVAIGSKGRDLALLRPEGDPLIATRRLEEGMKGTDDQRAILDAYRQAVRDEKLVEFLPRHEGSGTYVGDAACVECHKEICAFLDTTPHERAFATLRATNDHHDPECVVCHVVAFTEKGGFVIEEQTPHLMNVQCEACHGPGEAHAQAQAPTPNGKLGDKFCLRCHDADNSPGFDFRTYWPKIEHK